MERIPLNYHEENILFYIHKTWKQWLSKGVNFSSDALSVHLTLICIYIFL